MNWQYGKGSKPSQQASGYKATMPSEDELIRPRRRMDERIQIIVDRVRNGGATQYNAASFEGSPSPLLLVNGDKGGLNEP